MQRWQVDAEALAGDDDGGSGVLATQAEPPAIFAELWKS
jgi:hypothetical protein